MAMNRRFRQQGSMALLLVLSTLVPFCSAAGFFIQSGSLTWYPPAKAARRYTGSGTYSVAQPPPATTSDNVYSVLTQATVIDPQTGKSCQAIESSDISAGFSFMRSNQKVLVVVMPQFGDTDSLEYAGMLKHVIPDMEKANISLRIVGIGNAKSAQMFSLFTGIPLENLRVDPTGNLHKTLNLHRGPNWDVPSWVPQEFLEWFSENMLGNDNTKTSAKQVVRAWMNYMAMSAGFSSPGTVPEIIRGYLGDRSAPERVHPEEKIRVGPLKIGPQQRASLWGEQRGHLRPVELAAVRLRSLMEVLTKFDDYVPDQRFLDWRGGTFLLDQNSCAKNGKPLYEYHDKGVLSYSETMQRPLSFLANYIGMERAWNPIGLNDPEFQYDY